MPTLDEEGRYIDRITDEMVQLAKDAVKPGSKRPKEDALSYAIITLAKLALEAEKEPEEVMLNFIAVVCSLLLRTKTTGSPMAPTTEEDKNA